MMKPGIGTYERFKGDVRKFSKEGRQAAPHPLLHRRPPGHHRWDMLNLALWLKANNFKLDQVQTFMPTPMAMATTMYHSRQNPCARCRPAPTRAVDTPKSGRQRHLQSILPCCATTTPRAGRCEALRGWAVRRPDRHGFAAPWCRATSRWCRTAVLAGGKRPRRRAQSCRPSRGTWAATRSPSS